MRATRPRRAGGVPDYLAACDAPITGMTIGWLPPLAEALRAPGVEETIRAARDGFACLGAQVEMIDVTLTDPMPISGTLLARPATKLKALARLGPPPRIAMRPAIGAYAATGARPVGRLHSPSRPSTCVIRPRPIQQAMQ